MRDETRFQYLTVASEYTDFQSKIAKCSFRSMETERKGSLHAWSKKYKGLADIISNQSLQVNKRDGF